MFRERERIGVRRDEKKRKCNQSLLYQKQRAHVLHGYLTEYYFVCNAFDKRSLEP